MSSPFVNEHQIVEALHQVPSNRWGEVLEFLDALRPPQGKTGESPDIPALAARVWTAEELGHFEREDQNAILLSQATRLIEQHRACPHPTTAWSWWTSREIRKLPPEQRDILLEASATIAAEDYETNPELTAFEAFGKDDLHVDSSNTETR